MKVASCSAGKSGYVERFFQPLKSNDIDKIVSAALDVLTKTGMKSPTPRVRDLALQKGCLLDDEGRLLFPRSLVEDIVSATPATIEMHGQDPQSDFEVGSDSVHFATGGAAVMMLDLYTQVYRNSTIDDLYDLARLADQLPIITWFARPVVATELNDLLELDLNTVYACAMGTTKHIGSSISLASHVSPIVDLLDVLVGKKGRFSQRPFLSVHATTVVSPLTFAGESSDVASAAATVGMPVLSLTGPQAGATSPAALAGTLVQATAESLAALTAIKLVNPDHPVIVGGWPFVSDLRTGAFAGGGAEQALLSAAMAQILNHCGLASGVPSCMTDSKVPDNQAGYEKGISAALAALAGPSLMYESAGMMASLLGCSLESMLIDAEMLSSVRRCMNGIEVSEDALSVDVIGQVARGPGHFLAHEQTLDLMQSEYMYPRLGDRSSPEEWSEDGSTNLWQRASAQVQELLSGYHPMHITRAADKEARRRYPIKLRKEIVRPSSEQRRTN